MNTPTHLQNHRTVPAENFGYPIPGLAFKFAYYLDPDPDLDFLGTLTDEDQPWVIDRKTGMVLGERTDRFTPIPDKLLSPILAEAGISLPFKPSEIMINDPEYSSVFDAIERVVLSESWMCGNLVITDPLHDPHEDGNNPELSPPEYGNGDGLWAIVEVGYRVLDTVPVSQSYFRYGGRRYFKPEYWDDDPVERLRVAKLDYQTFEDYEQGVWCMSDATCIATYGGMQVGSAFLGQVDSVYDGLEEELAAECMDDVRKTAPKQHATLAELVRKLGE